MFLCSADLTVLRLIIILLIYRLWQGRGGDVEDFKGGRHMVLRGDEEGISRR